MDGKTALVTGVVDESNSGAKANGWLRVLKALRTSLRRMLGCLAGLLAVALATFCAFQLHLNLSASGSLFFLIVVMVAVVWGFWEASITSLVAVNCLNYFFVPPLLTWRVSDPQDWVALANFEIAALIVSWLSTQVQAKAQAEARQRVGVEKLYQLSQRILLLDRRQMIGPQLVSLIQEIFGTETVALFDAKLARLDATGSRASELGQLARDAFFQDRTLQGPENFS